MVRVESWIENRYNSDIHFLIAFVLSKCVQDVRVLYKDPRIVIDLLNRSAFLWFPCC